MFKCCFELMPELIFFLWFIACVPQCTWIGLGLWRFYRDVNLEHKDNIAICQLSWCYFFITLWLGNTCVNSVIVSCRFPVGPGRRMWSSVDGVQPYAFWAPSRKHGMYLPNLPFLLFFSWKISQLNFQIWFSIKQIV